MGATGYACTQCGAVVRPGDEEEVGGQGLLRELGRDLTKPDEGRPLTTRGLVNAVVGLLLLASLVWMLRGLFF